jgi:menaquinone-dependent protoporphyrinogen oxidase
LRVLVAYGTKRGGTRGIAETIAETLIEGGDEVDLKRAQDVKSVSGYDMVIIGGALYANRWHRAARRLAKRKAEDLHSVPVWLFSSGPLNDSAGEEDIPAVDQVVALVDLTGARGHKTFGGRLTPDAKGFPASKMAKNRAGDWRDIDQIARWARETRSISLQPSP